MANLSIRNLDETLKDRLRIRAAKNRRSMENEAREILRIALSEEPASDMDLAAAIQQIEIQHPRLVPVHGKAHLVSTLP